MIFGSKHLIKILAVIIILLLLILIVFNNINKQPIYNPELLEKLNEWRKFFN
mgnify:FL=1